MHRVFNAFENRLDKLWINHPMKYNPDVEYNPKTIHQDPGSWRFAESQSIDDELNIEAPWPAFRIYIGKHR